MKLFSIPRYCKILWAATYLLIFFFLDVSCQRNTFQPKKTHSSFILNNKEVCYLGVKLNNDFCLDLLTKDLILDPQNNFTYLDPFSHPQFPSHLSANQYIPPHSWINLAAQDDSLFLSPFFQLHELMSVQKGQYALFSKSVIKHLEKLRNLTQAPIIITSGFRSPGYNRQLQGAAQWSRHIYGDAVDIFSNEISLEELAQHCLQLDASFYQIYRSHIHCDWRNEVLDKDFFTPMDTPLRHSVENSANVAEQLAQLVSIQVKRNKNWAFLEAFHPEVEDPGSILYSWSITAPSGEILYFKKKKIKLLPQHGLYEIQLSIGGSIQVQQSLNW